MCIVEKQVNATYYRKYKIVDRIKLLIIQKLKKNQNNSSFFYRYKLLFQAQYFSGWVKFNLIYNIKRYIELINAIN